jgi:dihydrofolate synthase / folylpolyglutamate synthase
MRPRPSVPPDSAPSASGAILARLSGLHPRIIDLSLGRIERLLDDLGRPQDALPPVVHVAGTNGKGSVLAFLRAMMEAAGLRPHVYTSPHLVRFTERIVVAGREIDEEALAALLEECERVNAGRPITFFEITTAAAMLAFARTPADVTLLETGLGGRLDATNVVSSPALTAITPVSLDHQSFLGDTLAAIAFEKAGILKPDVACVLAAQPPEAAAVIRARAAAVRAPLREEGTDWRVEGDALGRLAFAGDGEATMFPQPGLAGAHQVQNAGVAVACALRLAPAMASLDARAIARGIERAHWPARLQRLETGRLATLLPAGWELWLDGGHNPGAAAVLARHLAGWRDRPLHLIFGMLRSKDIDAFLTPLAPYVGRLAAVAIPGEAGSADAAETAAAARRAGIAAEPFDGVASALRLLAAPSPAPARVLICGSLYLAGAVLAENG